MNIRVYDLPTRVFHWLFAFCFITAFTIANTVDDDDVAFSYHMIAGLIMCFALSWRIVWGIFGSKHARFSDFSLNVADLLSYFKGIFSGSTRKWSGHNPASSWAALTMMMLAAGLGITGFMMASGLGSELIKELHELMANAFLVVVILHIAGIVIHQLNHRDFLSRSMITGVKADLTENTQPVAAHLGVGVIVSIMTIGFAVYLANNFDSNSRILTVFGSQLQLSESEKDHSDYGKAYEHEQEGSGDDKHD